MMMVSLGMMKMLQRIMGNNMVMKSPENYHTQNPYATADQMPLQAGCCTRAAQARIPFDRVETWKESRSRWLQD